MRVRKKNILHSPPQFYILFYDPRKDTFPMVWVHEDYGNVWYTYDILGWPRGVPTKGRESDLSYWLKSTAYDYREVIEQC